MMLMLSNIAGPFKEKIEKNIEDSENKPNA